MIAFPNAKINLGLNITKKRPDGYHELESCFFPIGWSDILEIIPSDKLEFNSTGIEIPGKPDQNLCLKAHQLLCVDFDLSPVKMHLHKIIPIGAGLGGGSSDGAFALKVMNDLFELNLTNSELESYAAQLGSDCPFFIQNRSKYVTGTGGNFSDIKVDLSGKQLIVVKPDLHISTGEAYAGIIPKPTTHDCKKIIEEQSITEWKDSLYNDFEGSIFPKHPEISALKSNLHDQGAIYASMTGSGSAVFGIFEAGEEVKVSTGKVWRQYLA